MLNGLLFRRVVLPSATAIGFVHRLCPSASPTQVEDERNDRKRAKKRRALGMFAPKLRKGSIKIQSINAFLHPEHKAWQPRSLSRPHAAASTR